MKCYVKNKLVFRKDKSCTGHITTLRMLVEQSSEWLSPLYNIFIDFKKVLDSVDRDVSWMLMQSL